MIGSTILDVAMGLTLTFLALSLVTSALTEAVASWRGWRAGHLLDGIKDLLNDPKLEGLALQIYNHALVNPRAPGTAATAGEVALGVKPSYVDPRRFADAFIDVVDLAQQTPAAVKAAVDQAITDTQLNQLVSGMVKRTGGNLEQMRTEIAAWFSHGMDRVSGAYKRHTQLYGFLFAFVIAATLNVDALHVGKTLWQHPELVKNLKLDKQPDPAAVLGVLDQYGLPIGWGGRVSAPDICREPAPADCWHKWFAYATWRDWLVSVTRPDPMAFLGLCFATVTGWAITAAATLFGAPFWYDALQRVVRLKGTGPEPTPAQPTSSKP